MSSCIEATVAAFVSPYFDESAPGWRSINFVASMHFRAFVGCTTFESLLIIIDLYFSESTIGLTCNYNMTVEMIFGL